MVKWIHKFGLIRNEAKPMTRGWPDANITACSKNYTFGGWRSQRCSLVLALTLPSVNHIHWHWPESLARCATSLHEWRTPVVVDPKHTGVLRRDIFDGAGSGQQWRWLPQRQTRMWSSYQRQTLMWSSYQPRIHQRSTPTTRADLPTFSVAYKSPWEPCSLSPTSSSFRRTANTGKRAVWLTISAPALRWVWCANDGVQTHRLSV